MNIEYLSLLIIAGFILYALFSSARAEAKKRRAREAENKQIQEILGGFDIHAERDKVTQILIDAVKNTAMA